MDVNSEYLGRGVKWPIEVNLSGQIALQSGVSLVAQSILRYLSTPIGTEFFNESEGSRIHQIGYEPNDELLTLLLDMLINEAVDLEPRAEYIRTEFTKNTNENVDAVLCRIIIRIKQSNEIESIWWNYNKDTN